MSLSVMNVLIFTGNTSKSWLENASPRGNLCVYVALAELVPLQATATATSVVLTSHRTCKALMGVGGLQHATPLTTNLVKRLCPGDELE
jgi:hypothetical protein